MSDSGGPISCEPVPPGGAGSDAPRQVAVVLAAGGGSRFTGPSHKLLAPWRGRPLLLWSVNAALGAGTDAVWVVAGALDLAGVVPPEVEIVDNPAWRNGQATSLGAALDEAQRRNFDAVVVGLADQPLVPPGAWRAVAAARTPIAVATYQGKRRNPVRLARQVWPLIDREGDQGARQLIHGRRDLVSEVACEGSAADIDTVEDLSRWS